MVYAAAHGLLLRVTPALQDMLGCCELHVPWPYGQLHGPQCTAPGTSAVVFNSCRLSAACRCCLRLVGCLRLPCWRAPTSPAS
jgi:hypothetical protein